MTNNKNLSEFQQLLNNCRTVGELYQRGYRQRIDKKEMTETVRKNTLHGGNMLEAVREMQNEIVESGEFEESDLPVKSYRSVWFEYRNYFTRDNDIRRMVGNLFIEDVDSKIEHYT